MTIQVLSDVIVPLSVLLAGVSGTQTRQNDRTVNQGGYASANVVRDVTIRSYQLGIAPMAVSAWADMEGIYEATDAGAFGMLLEDPKDSVVTTAQGALMGYQSGVQFGVSGFGNGCPTYILQKKYTARGSSRTRSRDITRPRGTPAMLRGGSPVIVGVSSGNVSLSAAPVYVTFVPDATQAVNVVTVGATTQITLASAIGVVIGGRLWLQGLTGTDAALLNEKSHEVTNVVGTVYTLATNTAGKSITAAGQGHKYPQPDEALSWSGEFYVPVHFRDDNLDWEMVVSGSNREGRQISGPSIMVDEVREA